MNIIKSFIPVPPLLNFLAQKYGKNGGASLLSVVEKKYADVSTDHVVEFTEMESDDEQSGLENDRSCTDNVLTVRQSCEKIKRKYKVAYELSYYQL